MKMTKTLIASALLAGSSAALAEISGNVALTTDYVFRGVSQTDNQFALQGGFDYAHESGFYAGTWASNVDSNFFSGTSTDPQIELDLYAGFSGELENGVGYDVGILHYDYPGYSASDTNEVYVSGSYNNFTVSFNYSDELSFIGSDESAWYLAAGYDMDLPEDFGLSLHVGLNDGDAYDTTSYPTQYVDWSVGLSKSVGGVDLGLTYTDTDDDGETLFGGVADSKVVFSVSKSL